MLDLSFGLPIVVRDAALKMVAPGPQSDINRQYYAQEHEKEIEEGRGAIEAYDKTDEKARDLLKRLAQSEPFYKKQRRLEAEGEGEGESAQKALPASGGDAEGSRGGHVPGPIRTRDTRGGRGGMRGGRGGRMPGAAAAPSPEDWLPPRDPNIASLFVTGVEDDLPEHEIRTHFAQYGQLRSVVCSHRAHCAYINYVKRQDAETAAEALKGKVVVKGCPLKVTWGRPKQLDSMDQNVRMMYAREGRQTVGKRAAASQAALEGAPDSLDSLAAIAPPPGADDEVKYASLAGN
jgi:pre-mRNA-splicing factor RBM22/SLT11